MRYTIIFVALWCALFPPEANAHLVTTGMGPTYDGIGHLLLSPDDLIPVLAIAIYGGLRGTGAARNALFVVPLAWFIGGVIALLFPNALAMNIPPAVSFILLGGLVAADLPLPTPLIAIVVALTGLVHGYANGIALMNGPHTLGLLGIAVTLFVMIALAAAVVVTLKRPWQRIVCRVLGGWIVAIGVLMLGWSLSATVA